MGNELNYYCYYCKENTLLFIIYFNVSSKLNAWVIAEAIYTMCERSTCGSVVKNECYTYRM
jgi:hypothetical protein